MKKLLWLLLLVKLSYALALINIVAAENFYGELAKEIGGNNVRVHSILTNPVSDPHLFTTTPAIAKLLDDSQIVIYNGANYDNWIEQILQLQHNKKIIKINVAQLVNREYAANPHIWYLPTTMVDLAKTLALLLTELDKIHQRQYTDNLALFMQNNNQVQKEIASIKYAYGGTKVTATEPVFNYMLEALGFNIQGVEVQWKIMNGTEPSPKMLASYQDLLIHKKIRILFYNNQVIGPITQNMLALAKKYHIAVVGITETMPINISVNQWLLNGLMLSKIALQK